MPDAPATLAAAIDTAGLSARRFAVEVLGVDERTVRRWLAGDSPTPEPVRRLCLLIEAEPALAQTIVALVAAEG